MANLCLTSLSKIAIAELQRRAERNQRSLEDEAKVILQQALLSSNQKLEAASSPAQNLSDVAARLRILRQQIAWKNAPIRELIDEGRRY